jgi:hypothetical protein
LRCDCFVTCCFETGSDFGCDGDLEVDLDGAGGGEEECDDDRDGEGEEEGEGEGEEEDEWDGDSSGDECCCSFLSLNSFNNSGQFKSVSLSQEL